MQSRQQQVSQQQEVPQPGQQTAVGPVQNTQQTVAQSQHSAVPQAGLQPHQPVSSSPGVQNVNPSMHPVPQSVVSAGGIGDSGVVQASVPQQQNPSNQQYNTASLCLLGQETVHEIVSKVQDIFQYLKTLNPPLGTVASSNQSSERRTKLQDSLRTVKALFRRLRVICEKCNEHSQFQGMEYMHIESLIPVKEEWDMKTSEERKTSEPYRLASDECKELIDLAIKKNDQLKEIIDHLRRIVWEINTMLMMRKS